MDNKKKRKSIFIESAIPPDMICSIIAKHESKTDIGAHAIFLGQVRADESKSLSGEGKTVSAIIYSAYDAMAEKEFKNIKEAAIKEYDLNCLHIFHSIGEVKVGEISMLVMVSSGHREKTFTALDDIVQQIKDHVPIWKKEIFEDGTERWVGEREKKITTKIT